MSGFDPAKINPASIVLNKTSECPNNQLVLIIIVIVMIFILHKINNK